MKNKALKKAIALAGGTQEALAELLGVKQGHVYYWLHKSLPVKRAMQIEAALNGKVTKEELKPEIFGKQITTSP